MMRLLNIRTYELRYFQDSDIPPYAILSHTWSNDEVSFRNLGQTGCTVRQGWQKILGCCKSAVEYNVEWIWIDTCCIDKTSSAELSEAIISMYNWYRQAIVCIVYLSDFEHRESWSNSSFVPDFESCRWFTRGWTLQELLAPRRIIFYNRDWQKIGGRDTLCDAIARASGISADDLLSPIAQIPVERKLSWLSTRHTTRPEDMAYSMVGLCNISMPALYGEGRHNAMRRLQAEVDRISEPPQLRQPLKLLSFEWWFFQWKSLMLGFGMCVSTMVVLFISLLIVGMVGKLFEG